MDWSRYSDQITEQTLLKAAEKGMNKSTSVAPVARNYPTAYQNCISEHQNCIWIFNSLHTSHMEGAWEHMSGIAQRILDSMLVKTPCLTHETLSWQKSQLSSMPDPGSSVFKLWASNHPYTRNFTDTKNKWLASTPRGVHHKKCVQTTREKSATPHQYFLEVIGAGENHKPNLEEWDLILLRDKDIPRISWPMGLVYQISPSTEGLVCEVDINIVN